MCVCVKNVGLTISSATRSRSGAQNQTSPPPPVQAPSAAAESFDLLQPKMLFEAGKMLCVCVCARVLLDRTAAVL